MESSGGFDQNGFSNDAVMDPFTVFACTVPVVDTRTWPFTVYACTSLFSASASTPPFTVLPRNPTPSGTRTTKSTRAPGPLSPNGRQTFSPGKTLQIVDAVLVPHQLHLNR